VWVVAEIFQDVKDLLDTLFHLEVSQSNSSMGCWSVYNGLGHMLVVAHFAQANGCGH